MIRVKQEDTVSMISLLLRCDVRPHVLGVIALVLTYCIIKWCPNVSTTNGFAYCLSGTGSRLFLVLGCLALLLTGFKAGKPNNPKIILVVIVVITVAVHAVKTLSWTSLPRPSGSPGGYPSGHAAVAFALAFLLSCRYQRWAAIWYAAAAGISWSRVVVGAHFPFQVYVGSALGLFAAILLYDVFAPNKLLQELVCRAQLVVYALVPLAAVFSTSHEYENDLVVFGFGGMCIIAGVLIRVWTHTAHTNGDQFCGSGPYALIRHPALVANTFICVGITVASEVIWLLPLVLILCMIAIRMVAQEEESKLLTLYGSHYAHYMSKVPRWFPRLGDLPKAEIVPWGVVPALKREVLAMSLIVLPLIKEAVSRVAR